MANVAFARHGIFDFVNISHFLDFSKVKLNTLSFFMRPRYKMELILLPKDTKIYRSFTDPSKRTGYWYSLNESDTYGYGSQIGEFKLSRDLRLINLANADFYNILKKLIIDATTLNDSLRQTHYKILYPLGFDDIAFYRDLSKKFGIDSDHYNVDPVIHTESILYFNNRSRLSIHELDVELMKFLKPIVGSSCDGVICLKRFPDIIRNGMQPPELSVFDKSLVDYVQDKPMGGTVIGGANFKYLPKVNLPEDLAKSITKEMDEAIEQVIKSNYKFDFSSVKVTMLRYEPDGSLTPIDPPIKKTRKTYKRKRTESKK